MKTEAWVTVGRPGYMGDARDRLAKEWDEKYGAGQWRLAWQFGPYVFDRSMALQVYEDAYLDFLWINMDVQRWLTQTASDVYDTAPSNVHSGFDYNIQETPNNHFHDIAVRRAVARLGLRFEGDHLVEIRGETSEGYRLNPGIVKFHKPWMIYEGEIKNASGKREWWKKGTIEDFYQRNKVLQTRIVAASDEALKEVFKTVFENTKLDGQKVGLCPLSLTTDEDKQRLVEELQKKGLISNPPTEKDKQIVDLTKAVMEAE